MLDAAHGLHPERFVSKPPTPPPCPVPRGLVGARRTDGVDEAAVDPAAEATDGVVHEGLASGHPSPEVVSDGAEHHHGAAGHVLTGVLAHALHHGQRAAVADREALAGPPGHEQLPAGPP